MTSRASSKTCAVVSSIVIPMLFASLCALPSVTFAGSDKALTVYVDSAAGNDADPGTQLQPWKSLAKVNATTFPPGSRILLKSGSVWKGQLWPKGSGSSVAPSIVDYYGGGVLPRIDGDGLAEDAVLLKNQEYWEIQNLEITNRGEGDRVRRGVHADANEFGDMHHVYLRNMVIHDVNGTDSVKPNGGIAYTAEGDRKPSRFIDLRIENNQIYRVDRSGIFGWSTHWLRSKWYPTLGLVVRGNHLSDIGGDGIVAVAADGAVIEHNVVAHANQRSAGYNVAIWAWSSDHTLIQHNEAFGTHGQRDGEGFDSDWNSQGTIIQYNYSHDNDGGFLLICDDGSQPAEASIGNIGTIVRYNISVNDRTRGINLSGPVRNSQIYNNTIYVGSTQSLDVVQFADWHGWSDRSTFYNNVFDVAGKGRIAYGISRAEDGAYVTAPGFGESKNNAFDSNVYHGNIVPPADPHGITSDPQFARGKSFADPPRPLDLQLRPGSPLIDTGRELGDSVLEDYFGNKVPACKGIDRGAVEQTQCQ